MTDPSKGIVYYTHGQAAPDILSTVRAQLDRARGEIPVVSVSLVPLGWPAENGRNIALDLPPSILTMFKQQLVGLQALESDIAFSCEHDVLYHASHFAFTPPRPDIYYFNLNVWAVDYADGKALYYDGMKMTSGLVAYRPILVEHYTKKIAWVEEVGTFSRRNMGFEPGKKVSKGRVGDYDWATFRSESPNVDIKHGQNITRKRFAIEEYQSRRLLKASWQLTDRVPVWGLTGGRVTEFLREHA